MMRKILLFAVVSGVILSACSHRVTTEGEGSYSHTTTAEYDYFFLEALRLQNKGDYPGAFDLLSLCRDIDPEAPETYYMLGVYYSDLELDSLADASLKKAIELNPKNDAYHERLAQWYLQTHEFDSAIDAYERLYASNRSRSDVLELLMRLYQQQRDYDNLLYTIERYEQVEGTSEDITLSKMQTYQLKGDKQSAYLALKQLSDEHPHDANFKVMLGNWLQQNDRADEARGIFLEAERNEPNNEYVAASLYDFYRLQGEDSLATVYRDRILLNKHTATTTRVTMLQNIIRDNERQGGDSTQVLALFDQIMAADTANADLAELKAAYMSLKEMPSDSVNLALRHVLAIAPDRLSARLRLLQSEWSLKNWDEIIEICEPALIYNPEEVAFCYYLGIAQYQKGDTIGTLETLRSGISRINGRSDAEMVSDFYSFMGDIQHQIGNRDDAYAAYDSCLQWMPENISCLNNYAYYLSVEDGDLKKAEAMSLKTINREPNNPVYLDTYAWILYKQERYSEAKVFIDRTIENVDTTQNNSTMYDHAGDIYEACDEPDQAVEFWHQAILAGPDDEALIRKKIKKYEK